MAGATAQHSVPGSGEVPGFTNVLWVVWSTSLIEMKLQPLEATELPALKGFCVLNVLEFINSIHAIVSTF